MKILGAIERVLFRLLRYPRMSIYAADERAYQHAQSLVRFFYYSLMFFAITNIPSVSWLRFRQGFTPLWPYAWIAVFPYQQIVAVCTALFIGSSLLGGFLSWHTSGRILSFVGIFLYHTMESSFGQPNHQWYPWLYTAFLFLFLPQRGKTVEQRKRYMLIFWFAQVWFFLTYSMSGTWKLTTGLMQTMRGEISNFHPYGLALQVANWLPIRQAKPLLAPFLIQNPWVGWPMLLGTIYLEVFSLWAAIRPSIQRLWAFGLILFHVGTYLFMDIDFFPSTMLLILFYFDSPFCKPRTTWKNTVRDLPLFGWIVSRFHT